MKVYQQEGTPRPKKLKIEMEEGKLQLFQEVSYSNIEGEFIFLTLKGLLKHLEKVEAKIFYFGGILSYSDYSRITQALGTLKTFLKFVLTFATVDKHPRGVKGTFV